MRIIIASLFVPLVIHQKTLASSRLQHGHFNRVLILVPGSLNSIVPGPPEQYLEPSEEVQPYFSNAIIIGLKKQFDAVRVTPHLDYFGDIKKNGGRVYIDTFKWYSELTENMIEKPEIWIFGHSAGGLYALFAAHLNNQNSNTLPIKKITMLSTPLKGVEFIDRITQLPFVFEKVAEFFLNTGWPLDFRGLWGLKNENVEAFLSELTLSQNLQIDAFAGTQTEPEDADETFDSHYLSPPLTALQRLITHLGDGIVSKRSALSDQNLSSADGSELRIKSHPEFVIKLDHIEQVWDYRYLRALGTINPVYILKKQIESYEAMFEIISH